MTKAFAAAAMIVLLAPSAALAQHRAGDAALGAVSGAVVLGPIGAVAGAFIGYSAGPAIARSWGIDRSGSARHRRQASKARVRGARAEVIGTTRPAAPRVEKDARVATSGKDVSNAAPAARTVSAVVGDAPAGANTRVSLGASAAQKKKKKFFLKKKKKNIWLQAMDRSGSRSDLYQLETRRRLQDRC